MREEVWCVSGCKAWSRAGHLSQVATTNMYHSYVHRAHTVLLQKSILQYNCLLATIFCTNTDISPHNLMVTAATAAAGGTMTPRRRAHRSNCCLLKVGLFTHTTTMQKLNSTVFAWDRHLTLQQQTLGVYYHSYICFLNFMLLIKAGSHWHSLGTQF